MYEACLWPVSNAGVILKLGHLSIGIDLFTETEIAPYREMPKELYLPLMGSTKSLDLLLITHTHKDHYQKSKIEAYLSLHPQCQFYVPSFLLSASQQTANDQNQANRYSDITKKVPKKVLSSSYTSSSLTEPFLDVCSFGHGDTLLHFLSTEHMGQSKLVHSSILIQWQNHSIFISGDARPSHQLYETLHYLTPQLDVLIAPFPCLSLKSARKKLSSYFLPRQIFLVHLADPNQDLEQWTLSAKKICKMADDSLPFPVFCETFGLCHKLF